MPRRAKPSSSKGAAPRSDSGGGGIGWPVWLGIAAVAALGFGWYFLPLAECNLPQIDAAIDNTAQATPQLKQQILNSLIAAAAADGQLQKREAELLRAIADAFGSPIPPFLGTTHDVTL